MQNKLLFPLLLSALGLQAQNNTVSSGGNATGSNGSVSYTVGQIAYKVAENANFSASEGVQQPIEIIPLTTTIVEGTPAVKIYPNPTYSGFYATFPKLENNNTTYELSDISGKSIKHGKINALETFIKTDELTSGIYFFKINNGSSTVGTYKIIKQ